MSLIKIHAGNCANYNDNPRSSRIDIENIYRSLDRHDQPSGAGACKTGACGATSTPSSKVKVEKIQRTGPGWKQNNLKFTDPKSGQSVKPDRETFKFLLDRGYKPKQEKGSSSTSRSYCWRKPGSEADVSPTTVDFLKSQSTFVLTNF